MKHEQLTQLISELKKTSIEEKVRIWKRVASDLEKSTRRRRQVNIYRIEKNAKPNEIIVVPGKVLGSGELTKTVVVAAFNFSDSAYQKIKIKGQALSITELLKKNPQGKKVRIIG
ncbi:50S ribosomal protein L18e [Candidatus Woesearchaeota archaeon]|jgi:large subunit ribosomal protein L18e|nr:50S ribosomal protein L18e [Candidatus Woesearchaeota archaeon]|tara:strand:- start:587 stop:931 length:345 start_codon:yes stop_codon:yes gene_type:complete